MQASSDVGLDQPEAAPNPFPDDQDLRFVNISFLSTHEDTADRCELDSHADTCVAGSNTAVLLYTGEKVSVSPFIGEYQPLPDIPIATVATAWDNPVNGDTILLIVNEALYFGDRLKHSLLCPNQLRHFGLQVNDVPKEFVSGSSHSIIIPDHGLEIPLELSGVISYIPTRLPTQEELSQCLQVEITSPSPWLPYSSQVAQVYAEHLHLTSCANPIELQMDLLHS